MLIESGTGNGKLAAVDDDNRLITTSFHVPFEHLISKDYEKTFHAQGKATPVNGTIGVLLLRNDNSDKQIVITRIILQAVGLTGGTSLPSAANYFRLETDATYTSGGTAVSPTNLTSGSSVVSNATVFEDGFTYSSVPSTQFWPNGSTPMDLRTNGSIIVPPRKSVSVAFIGDNTGGVVSASVSFAVVGIDEYSG